MHGHLLVSDKSLMGTGKQIFIVTYINVPYLIPLITLN
jgi:hypothetical protein